MITAIPNQPINFLPSEIIVDCPDKRLPLIVDAADVIRFQVAIDAPNGGSYGYGNEIRDWQVVFTWAGVGAWVSDVQGWLCANEPSAGGYIEPFADTLSPTVGVVYQVVVDVPSISGTATFSMAGQSFVISSPGSSTFLVVAATTAGPRITLDNSDSLICVERVRVYEVFGGDGGCIVNVEVVEAVTDDVLLSVDSDTRPDLFAVGSSNITASISLVGIEDIEGKCVFLRISSSCDDGGSPLCSQSIKVGECDGTILVRACLDHDAMGFDAPAIFEARLKASLVRPRWEHDSSEERWSDGTINRYYIDRQRVMPLLLQMVDETLHPFLAALCMFDHVYLGASEYSVDANGYDPDYSDALTGTAGTLLTVRPKRELMRRVTCEAPGTGCDPANDPPCSAPNVFLSYRYDAEDGGWFVDVTIYSAIGFLPEHVTAWVNDSFLAQETWTTPTSFTFGPIPLSADVRIEISNKDEPSCDWTWEHTFPTCDGPGFGRFATGPNTTTPSYFELIPSVPRYVTVRTISSSSLGPEDTFSAGVPHDIEGNLTEVERCFYGSDTDGVPWDSLSEVYLRSMNILWIDVSQLHWLEVLDVGDNAIGALDLSGNPNLLRILASDNAITSVIWPPGPTSMVSIHLSTNAGLTTLPTLSGALLDNGVEVYVDECALDAAAIEMLIFACWDSGTVGGTFDASGGTNAPLPVVGPVAAMIADLITLGWTVNGN